MVWNFCLLTKAAFLNGRRKPRTALFVLQCRGIYSSSFDPVLTSASSPSFFCRPVLNRQNRFRLHLNEWPWMDGGRGRGRRKVKSWKYSAEVVVLLLLGKGGGERRRREPRERVFYTCTFLFIFLSSPRRPRVGRTTMSTPARSPFFSVLAMM